MSCCGFGGGGLVSLRRLGPSPLFKMADKEEETNASSQAAATSNLMLRLRRNVTEHVLGQIEAKLKNARVRRELVQEADTQYCGEAFRFLAAILDWESMPMGVNKKLAAFKIIATYVESGSLYECNMSATTRSELIDHKAAARNVDHTLFDLAKLELVVDVLQNPFLKGLLQIEGSSSSPQQYRRLTDTSHRVQGAVLSM